MNKNPTLLRVVLGTKDITKQMYELYGEYDNWNTKEIRYQDFMKKEDVGSILEVKWRQPNKRIDTSLFRILDIDSEFRYDLFFPNQSQMKWVKI